MGRRSKFFAEAEVTSANGSRKQSLLHDKVFSTQAAKNGNLG
jgi:hypothetical protein